MLKLLVLTGLLVSLRSCQRITLSPSFITDLPEEDSQEVTVTLNCTDEFIASTDVSVELIDGKYEGNRRLQSFSSYNDFTALLRLKG